MVSSKFKELLYTLGIPEDKVEILEARGGIMEDEFEGIRYLRFKNSVGKLRRGTVLFEDGTTVFGFPHIKRIVNLSAGVRKIFKSSEFYVEEKVDGYNVRVVKFKDRILGITRGGFICPYTTERIAEFVPEEFFKDHKDLVLVGEMAGPESPYLVEGPPYVKEDIQFFLFDIQDIKTGSSLPVEERLKLAEEYGINHVEVFGRYSYKNIDDLYELVERLSREGREGIVMKSPDMKKIVKYVTPYANINDIKIGARVFYELPGGYFTSRISRLAFYIAEKKIRGEELHNLALQLGKALLQPLVEAIHDVTQGDVIAERFRVRVRKIETAYKMVTHFEKLGLEIEIEDIEEIEGGWRVTFKRVYPEATREIRDLIGGKAFVD
ncbi:MAG: putative ATP-dependent ligase [Pyrococcus sp.]|uniref:RNA ligase n=1 Tax=Pyrococcus sp. TaxID=33866 RepID=UPI00258B92E3|nr:RNA ligase [Pyrococcus sp.]MDK2869283.1 putative ATP-dependent ligase [Pyrococcus sp.]